MPPSQFVNAGHPIKRLPHDLWMQVTPLSAPLEGDTLITIHGSNLGSSFRDVRNVTVANVACVPVEEMYEVSKT